MADMTHLNTFWLVADGEFTLLSGIDAHKDGSPILEGLRKHVGEVYFERIDLHGGAGDWIGTLWVDEDAILKRVPGNALATDLAVKFANRSSICGNLRGPAILQCVEHLILEAE